MGLKIARGLMGILGLIGGFFLTQYGLTVFSYGSQSVLLHWGLIASGSVLCGLIGLIIAKPLYDKALYATRWLETKLKKMPLADLIAAMIGLIAGLLVAFLVSGALKTLPVVGDFMPLIATLILGYLGVSVGYRWRDVVAAFLEGLHNVRKREKPSKKIVEDAGMPAGCVPKVLDTSVIIDGRIIGVCRTGFLEGPLVITDFILDELRHIADSADAQKRNRGRRGLDVLNELRELDIEVKSWHEDYKDIAEVDSKLVRLAQDLKGCVVTNDYNLNKVASFNEVRVLNVNELAGAIKTVLLPGEPMRIHVANAGKEADQGVGYLDDGTMVVIENGKKLIGETIDAVVTSVIQTNAGRMIFAKPAEEG